ncbi:ABC transporter [Anaerococcus vaginalis]|uniref:ABC transporter n=1 Tax=Anaerococcus vaginalis TaxID=33037 RepID=UPI00189A5318|nr:ABC transporter [Anaerococcus vaginalis]
MSKKVLEIKYLNKSYVKRKIINNLNMTVFRGNIYSFLKKREGNTTANRMIT